MSLAIAIEGPCCAGKTTLGDGLRERLGPERTVILPDYADCVGGGAGMPSPDPPSLSEELAALDFLLDVEARRRVAYLPAEPPPIVLIDRSVLTLSAHCAGLDALHPMRDPFLAAANEVLFHDPRPLWPEIVLYLDATSEIQVARNHGRFAPDSIFLEPQYNAGFREWFAAYEGAIGWIDSEQPVERVLENAISHLAQRSVAC